jgi:hypothetical protein
MLGVSRPTLYTLLEAHGLSVEAVTSTLPDAEAPPPGDSVPLHNMD